jgi:tetratricopeptide (TPR) repeat protein
MFAQLIATALLLALGAISPALAANVVDADCSGVHDPDSSIVPDPDGLIEACTRILQGAAGPREKAIAAINRASATTAKARFGSSDNVPADRAAAEADLDEAVRLDPTFAFAHYARGLGADFSARRGDTADFDEAIRLDPNFALAFLGRARAYSYRGDDRRVAADLDAAIKLDPQLARAFLFRGRERARAGDDDGALADLSEALRLSSGDRDSVERRVHDWAAGVRGVVYFIRGDLDAAVADFSDALLVEPRDASALEQRGIVELMRGSLDLSRADLGEAAELAPTNADIALWREIADRRAQTQGRLAAAREKLLKTMWPASAVHAFLGEPVFPTMLEEASDVPDGFALLKASQICQAYVFTGELALLKEAKAEAAAAFDAAAAACPKGAPERGVVAAELKGLGGKR